MDSKTAQLLAEDLAACYDDPLRFVLWAFPWGTMPEMSLVKLPEKWRAKYPNCEYGPDVWACELLDDVGRQVKERKFDGKHAVEPIRMAVASGHGIGKLLENNVFVDTPDGVRRWGDIQVGDRLWGPDGKPTSVVAIPYEGVRPCYKVTFDDGSSTIAGKEHLWTVKGRNERRTGGDWVTLETHEILERGVKRKNGKAFARQWEVPRYEPVEYPEADQPLPPYLVGLALGNGSAPLNGSLRIDTPSGEVMLKIDELYGLCNCRVDYNEGKRHCATVSFKGCQESVRASGLAGCRSWEKFIPNAYKYASVEQRAELFRGLIDSDGEVTKQGALCYSTVSKQLCDDVLWLVRSLGGKAQVQPTVKRAFYYGKDGERVDCRDCYRLTLTMPRGFVCGYYQKRVSRIKPQVEDRYLTRWIESIEPVGDLAGKCVTVDREDGLFLANDFIVTHNSAITAWIVCWLMATRPNCKGVVTANTAAQLETKTWAEITKWMRRSLVKDLFDCKSTSITALESPESWRVDALTCREENAESFAGQHAASSTPFYVFDEASAIPEAVYDVAEGGLTDGEPMIFLFGNPTRNSGRFFECFHKRAKYWNTRTIDSRNVAITNKKQIAQWEEEYGEDSDFFKVRVKGEFPSQGADQFIPAARVRAAMDRGSPATNASTCAMVGVDVARFGDDDTVIFTRIGRDGATVPVKRFHGLNTVQVVGQVKEHIRYLRTTLKVPRVHVFVDEGGVGGGPVDILKEDGFPVRGINFAETPDDKDKYPGKREEMWDRMAEWLKEGSLPDDKELQEDLVSPTYSFDTYGRKKLESKKDMKKRGLRSPDAADAVALTFACRVNEYEGEYGGRRESQLAQGRRNYNPFANLMRKFF